MSRNKNRLKTVTASEDYFELLDKRKITSIEHFDTPILRQLTVEHRSSLMKEKHIWQVGDRYHKLAAKHYGDPKLWWIIAWYNTAPTESHLKLGDLILIPFPLERVLRLLRVV